MQFFLREKKKSLVVDSQGAGIFLSVGSGRIFVTVHLVMMIPVVGWSVSVLDDAEFQVQLDDLNTDNISNQNMK